MAHTVGSHEELSAWATDPVTIHQVWLACWLDGQSAREAVLSPAARATNCEAFGSDIGELLLREVAQQYNLLHSLTPFLNSPHLLQDQTTYHLPMGMSAQLCEKYYSFDDIFFRELMGRQLESSLRRTVDTIAQTYGLRETSCRRQFDNLRRVSKALRPGMSQGTVVDRIMRMFMLSHELASKYYHVIFMCANQISLARRSFGSLSFADVSLMVAGIIAAWGQAWNTDFDQTFSDEVRMLSADQQRIKTSVMHALHGRGHLSQVLHKFMGTMINQMAVIVGNLYQSREVRDLFVDVVDKIIEPLRKLDVRQDDLLLLFDALGEGAAAMGGKQATPWQRCFKGFRVLVLGLYNLKNV